MPRKISLEAAITKAAAAFAMEIVDAVKGASLQELLALQGEKPKRRGRKPGRKPGPKPKAKKKVGRPRKAAAKRGPGRPKKAVTKKPATKKTVKKKRVVKNYPKCAYPKCNKNRFPRGKGFCGDHWRQWKSGKIKDAASYKKK